MKIEWNKVTWYSKLIALLLLIALPIIGFQWGMRYQRILEKSPNRPALQEVKVCKGEACVSVEVVDNAIERAYGLMYRKELGENRGMLFIFEAEGNYPFWMKNTLIPLDMIWINNANQIVYIHKGAEPCTATFCPSINPNASARYVLEVNAGKADEMGLKVGDMIQIYE